MLLYWLASLFLLNWGWTPELMRDPYYFIQLFLRFLVRRAPATLRASIPFDWQSFLILSRWSNQAIIFFYNASPVEKATAGVSMQQIVILSEKPFYLVWSHCPPIIVYVSLACIVINICPLCLRGKTLFKVVKILKWR